MRKLYIIFCILYLYNAVPALAQQTIFNVPSADVTPEKQIYMEQESQFRPYKPGQFWLATEYPIFGVGHHTETGILIYNVSSPASNNITLAPGFKTSIPVFLNKFPDREIKLIGGSEVLVSVQGQEVGNWSYAEISGRLPRLKTRLTAGISVGTKQIFGRNAVSFIAGYEHPVTKNFILQGDWFSGNNNFGFFIPGFSYAFPKNFTLYAGYQIPNTRACGYPGFVIELAKIF